MATPPDLHEIARLLSYDPHKGLLTWRVSPSPRVKIGDEAGTMTPDGYIGVNIGGQRVPAHYLAWALYHRKWPEEGVALIGARNGETADERYAARSDLRIENLALRAEGYSLSKAAIRQRAYNARQRSYAQTQADNMEKSHLSEVTGVRYSMSLHKWLAESPYETSDNGSKPTLGLYDNRLDAEQAMLEHTANYRSLEKYPQPVTEPEHLKLTAGVNGARLSEINFAICYDRDRGTFIWRQDTITDVTRQEPKHNRKYKHMHARLHRPKRGRTAERTNTAGTVTVTWNGRHYPAHMLAWFIVKKVWPRRKSIIFKDGDRTNLKFENLKERPE